MADICPWPECERVLQSKAVFCSEHHFRVSAKSARFLLRLKLELVKSGDEDIKRHLRTQIASYANSAIRASKKEVESVS